MKHLFASILIAFLTAFPLLAQNEQAAESEAAPEPTATPAAPEKAPIDMFEILDYDENLDVFYEPGTKKPYSGPVMTTYDNGVLEMEGVLKNGHEEGWWVDYYEDGTKTSEGVYRGGNEEGYWKYYHENGAFESGGKFENGVPVGEWVSFFENGKPDFVGQYVDGLMDGDWTFYDETTGESRIIKFDKGTQLNN